LRIRLTIGLMVIGGLILASCAGSETAGGELPITEAPTEMPTESVESTEPAVTEQAADLSLREMPITPEVSDSMIEVYQQGIANGRNPAIFTKVGDCMTDSPDFLYPIAAGEYDLGEFATLQPTIEYFSSETVREKDGAALNSFANKSIAVACGFNSASPHDPTWADPNICESGETPLACEIRLSNASIALIMLGTHDMHFEKEKYAGYLERIVQETLAAGVVPILTTFPPRSDDIENSEAYNEVLVEIAQEYDVPVANLWRALQDRPNLGLQAGEATHLSLPADGCATCFTEENLDYGATVQNWVALMALDAVLQAVQP
jgi:hypothetical protein